VKHRKSEKQADQQVQAKPEAVAEPHAESTVEEATAKQAGVDSDQVAAWTELQDLIQRARKGDKKTLPRLREFLTKNEFLWKSVGNLSVEAQAAWIKLVAGNDLYYRECLAKSVNALKLELSGKSPGTIEKLLCERVVMSWLQLGYMESREAQQGEQQLRWAEYQRRRQDQAYKQFMLSANALATLRRLVPQKTVYLPVVQQPAAINGAPASTDGHGHRQEHGHVNGHQTVNGNGKLNGHSSRFGHLLDTVGVGDG